MRLPVYATATDISTLRPIATSGVAARMMGIERAIAQAVSDPDQRQKLVPLPECDRRSLSCHFVFYYMIVPCVKIRSAIWPSLYYPNLAQIHTLFDVVSKTAGIRPKRSFVARDVELPNDVAAMLADGSYQHGILRTARLNRRLLEATFPNMINTDSLNDADVKLSKAIFSAVYAVAMWLLVFGSIGFFNSLFGARRVRFPDTSPILHIGST